MRNRLIVTGTAAAFVLTAGIVGAVAVPPSGQEQDRETSAAPSQDALQGLPPVMLKREPASAPGENGTVDVHSKPGLQKNPFTYTPAPKPEYTPRHMADAGEPAADFTTAPLPGVDVGQGTGPSSPTKPSVTPTPRPTQPPTESPRPTPTPTPTPDPTPTPTPSPDPTPTPTPTPTPEPTDPPSEEPTDPPSQEPTDPPTEEPTPEPTEEPTTEPSPDPSTEPSPEPSPSNSEGSTE